MTPKSSSSREAGKVAGRPSGTVEPLRGDAQERDAWPLGFHESEGNGQHRSLTADMGASLERDLLLAGATEDLPRRRAPGSSRILSRLVAVGILLAVLGSGVFFFMESRKTWEGKVLTLQTELSETREDSATRERDLLARNAAKDSEIADWKSELESMTSLANKTLEQLKTSLDDFRRLREEKLAVEEENRELLRQQKSPIGYFFANWLPNWLKESHLQPPQE